MGTHVCCAVLLARGLLLMLGTLPYGMQMPKIDSEDTTHTRMAIRTANYDIMQHTQHRPYGQRSDTPIYMTVHHETVSFIQWKLILLSTFDIVCKAKLVSCVSNCSSVHPANEIKQQAALKWQTHKQVTFHLISSVESSKTFI